MKDNREPAMLFEAAFRQAYFLGMLKKFLKYDANGNIVLKVSHRNKHYKELKEWLSNE